MPSDELTTPPGVAPVAPVVVPENKPVDPIANANEILAAIGKIGVEVRDLTGAFDAHKLQTADQIRAIRERVDGSLPPAPLAPGASPVSLAAEVRAIRAELADQSAAMGLGQRGIEWLFSKDGRKAMVRLATLAGAMYAALHAAGYVTPPKAAVPAPSSVVGSP